MSSHTYVCKICGSLRRRRASYLQADKPVPRDYPLCCERPMLGLVKGWAEAVTHLDPQTRVRWIALGARIIRRPGRRWRAALTPWQMALAREQAARYRGEDPARP